MEQRLTLLGISLSDLKVKLHLFIVCEMPASCLTFSLCLYANACCLILHLTLWLRSNSYVTFSSSNMLNATVVCMLCSHCVAQFSCLAIILSPAEPPAPVSLTRWPSLPPSSHCGPLSVLLFPFKTGGCDARMWVLRSGPWWARLAEQWCERCLCDNSLPGKFFFSCLGGNRLFKRKVYMLLQGG